MSESDDSSEEDGDEEEEDVTPLAMEEAIWGRDPKAARKGQLQIKLDFLIYHGFSPADLLTLSLIFGPPSSQARSIYMFYFTNHLSKPRPFLSVPDVTPVFPRFVLFS